MNPKHFARGFTLIELMIVVAIVAILAAIAFPSYKEQVARGRRGDAQAALLSTAQLLERQYTISNTYTGVTLPTLNPRTDEAYAISYGTVAAASAPTGDAFWLRMVPKGPMASDKCGTFAITNTGQKTDATGSGPNASCWDR